MRRNPRRPVTCSWCNTMGHNSRSCRIRINQVTNVEEQEQIREEYRDQFENSRQGIQWREHIERELRREQERHQELERALQQIQEEQQEFIWHDSDSDTDSDDEIQVLNTRRYPPSLSTTLHQQQPNENEIVRRIERAIVNQMVAVRNNARDTLSDEYHYYMEENIVLCKGSKAAISGLNIGVGEECNICYEEINKENMLYYPCNHVICTNCAFNILKTQKKINCHACRSKIKKIYFSNSLKKENYTKITNGINLARDYNVLTAMESIISEINPNI